MSDTPPNAPLLRSLGRLARGLSTLFWALPAALFIGVSTARSDWLKPLGFVPTLVVNAMLVYGLWQMGSFQKQERPWRAALDRALLLAVINLGLSPFIYWHNKVPEQAYFTIIVNVLEFLAMLFLFHVNLVLARLGAMLPDETLREETRQFTAVNRWLLIVLIVLTALKAEILRIVNISANASHLYVAGWLVDRGSQWLFIFLVLLTLAMTMALIWKAKEVILDAVFGSR